jgi:precorrin-6B methylase 2
MARATDFDLARELAKPSFTPAVRDAPALVDLIIAGDEPAATRAAPALARLGDAARTAVAARLAALDETANRNRAVEGANAERAGSDEGARAGIDDGAKTVAVDEGARARLVAVVGLLARAGDDAARALLVAQTASPAPRVRKAAAIALGKLGGDDARRALLARWDAGDAPPDERRALAEALGKVGGDAALARLKALDADHDAELMRRRDRAVLMADRTAQRDLASSIADDVRPPAPLAIQLTCRSGLGPLLLDELSALGIAAQAIGDRGATLRLTSSLSTVFASRLWAAIAFPIPLAAADDLVAAITRTIVSPPLVTLLRALTRGPIRWRLGFAHGHKRAIVWRVARDVTAAAPDLVNDPASTTWDFLVDDQQRTLSVVPRRLDDPRFAYRVADIPAASHPTVAAALALLAQPRPADRVWDPFCGSGLELIERARRGPARSLLGTDNDAAALDAARRNLDAAAVRAELALTDARTHAPGPVDLIITNPPLGSRVAVDAAALLVAALPNFARALAPRGRLVWITPSPRKTTPIAEQLGLVRTRDLAVDLGGVRGHLERWDRQLR